MLCRKGGIETTYFVKQLKYRGLYSARANLGGCFYHVQAKKLLESCSIDAITSYTYAWKRKDGKRRVNC